MNWKHYVSYWDNLIQEWIDNPIRLAHSNHWKHFNFTLEGINELPEPYYCGVALDSELDAVIVNLNPGASANNEWVKYHCFLDNPNAFISNAVKHNRSYHFINKNFNPLIRSTLDAVPGKQWWEDNRWKWLDRFYPFGDRKSPNGYKPEKILALELCPWHSKSFSFWGKLKSIPNDVDKHLRSFFIDPLSDSVLRSRLVGGLSQEPYGLCFSKTVFDVLTGPFHFKVIHKWDSSSPGLPANWPINPRTHLPINRTYTIIEGPDSEGRPFRLLCLWYNNIGVLSPSAHFQAIENHIKSVL